jgi:16S rRNA (uracil1498-N3)-methyltransferase
MRIHRFYIENQIENKDVGISDERLVHQWRHVFRYNVGSEVVLFNGSGFEYECVISFISNREAKLEVVSKKPSIIPNTNITLYQSLIKKDNFEWIAEKATELGVAKIVPVVSERSEKKNINEERLKKILIEASEQCGRGDVPELGEIVDLEDAIQSAENIIIFDKGGDPVENTFEVAASIFIGPEGGWSEKEINMFKERGAHICSLGPLTLRAETAAIVAMSKLTPPA